MSSASAVPGPHTHPDTHPGSAPHPPAIPDLTHRVDPALFPELMDGPCTYEQFRACVREIGFINRWTFAYGPTLRFLGQVAAQHPRQTPLRILDVGSGGGDVLLRIARWAHRRRLAVELTGIDLNPHATRAARELSQSNHHPSQILAQPQSRTAGPVQNLAQPESHTAPAAQASSRSRNNAIPIRWITGDVFTHPAAQDCDVVLSSLVTHHMRDPEIVAFLRWQEATARSGWFINDLSRSAASFRFFRISSRLLRLHPFVQADGLVSIRRAFREADWHRLLQEAGLTAHSGHQHAPASDPGRQQATGSHTVQQHSTLSHPVQLGHLSPGRLCVSRLKSPLTPR